MASPLESLGIDPAWLEKKRAELRAATEEDASAQSDADRAALLMKYAQNYSNRRAMPAPQARQVNDARSRFAADVGLETKARDINLDALKTYAALNKPKDPKDAPVSPQMRAALIKAGVSAETIDALPDTGAALPHLLPRGQVSNTFITQADGTVVAVPTKGPPTPRAVPGVKGAPALTTHAAAEEEEKDTAASFGGKFFKPRPGTPPNALAGDRTKLISATGEVADLVSQSGRLVDLYKTHGAEVTGPAAAEMRTLAKHVQLLAKGPGVYDLGVLNGQDYPLLKSVVDNPNYLDSIFKNAASFRDFVTEVETFKRIIAERVATRWDAAGYEPEAVEGSPFAAKPNSGVPGSGGASQKDLAAKAWADANPNDPRAKAIAARLKAKGL